MKRTINGAASYFYYDGWSLIEEDNSAGAAQLVYVYGPATDELAAMWSASTSSWSWYHYDARGSVIHLTNASGQVVEQYSYSAFGIPSYFSSTGQLLNSSTVGNRFLFQGRDWIKELSLYDYRNRMYHPGIGRFLQPDPLSLDAGDQNIYRYCNNDPVNYGDPLGLGDLGDNSGSVSSTDGHFYYGQPGSSASNAFDNYISGYTPPSTSIFSFSSSSYSGFGSSFGDLQSFFLPILRSSAWTSPGSGGRASNASDSATDAITRAMMQLTSSETKLLPNSTNRKGFAADLTDDRLAGALESNMGRIDAAGVAKMGWWGYRHFQYRNNSAEFYKYARYDYRGGIIGLRGVWFAHEVNYFVIGEAAAAHHETRAAMEAFIRVYVNARASVGKNGAAGGEIAWAHVGYNYYYATRALEGGY